MSVLEMENKPQEDIYQEDTTTQDNSAKNSREDTQEVEQEQVKISRADLKELQKFRAQAQKDLGVNKPGVISRSVGAVSSSITKDFQGTRSHLEQESMIGRQRLANGIKTVGKLLANLTKPVEYLFGAVPDYFINRTKDPGIFKKDATKLVKYGVPIATAASLVAAPGITLTVGGVTAVGAVVGVLGYKTKKATDKVIERYQRGKAYENAETIEKANDTQAQKSCKEIEKIKDPEAKKDANFMANLINETGLTFTKKRSAIVANDVTLLKTKEVSSLNNLNNVFNKSREEIVKSYQVIDQAIPDLKKILNSNENISEIKMRDLGEATLDPIFHSFSRNVNNANKLLNEFSNNIDGKKGLEVGQAYCTAVDVAEDITQIATKTLKDLTKVSKSDLELKARVARFNKILKGLNYQYNQHLKKGTLTKDSLTSLLIELGKVPELKYQPKNQKEEATNVETSNNNQQKATTKTDSENDIKNETSTKEINNLGDPKVREELLSRGTKVPYEAFKKAGLDDSFESLDSKIGELIKYAEDTLTKDNSKMRSDFARTLHDNLSNLFENALTTEAFNVAFEKTRHYLEQVEEIFSSESKDIETLNEDIQRLNKNYEKEIEKLISESIDAYKKRNSNFTLTPNN